MAVPDFITTSPFFNSFYFSEAVNNGLNILNQADYQNQILPWQFGNFYTQKALMTDPITLLFHCKKNPPSIGDDVTIDICDRFQQPITAINPIINAAPYYKGIQTVAGNYWFDPFTMSPSPLILTSSLYNFTFNDFILYLTPDTPLSYYYIRLNVTNDSTTKYYFSEPIYLRSDSHPYTMLFSGQYLSNRAQNANAVITGWYDDYPTNLTPYYPIFSIRCEGYILPYDMKLINIGYLMANYVQNFITGQQMAMRSLKLGENTTGIPEYQLQAITEILLADRIFIGTDYLSVGAAPCYYKVAGASNSTSPGEIWKVRRNDARTLIYASTMLSLGSLSQQSMVSPVSGASTGEYSIYDYDPSDYTT